MQQISPIVLTLIATVSENRADVQRVCLSQPDVSVSVNQLANGQIQWTIKTSEFNDHAVFSIVERICDAAGLKVSACWGSLFFHLRLAERFGSHLSLELRRSPRSSQQLEWIVHVEHRPLDRLPNQNANAILAARPVRDHFGPTEGNSPSEKVHDGERDER